MTGRNTTTLIPADEQTHGVSLVTTAAYGALLRLDDGRETWTSWQDLELAARQDDARLAARYRMILEGATLADRLRRTLIHVARLVGGRAPTLCVTTPSSWEAAHASGLRVWLVPPRAGVRVQEGWTVVECAWSRHEGEEPMSWRVVGTYTRGEARRVADELCSRPTWGDAEHRRVWVGA